MIPHIRQADGQIGFYWVTPNGQPTTLPDLVAASDQPRRLIPTHAAARRSASVHPAGRVSYGQLMPPAVAGWRPGPSG